MLMSIVYIEKAQRTVGDPAYSTCPPYPMVGDIAICSVSPDKGGRTERAAVRSSATDLGPRWSLL